MKRLRSRSIVFIIMTAAMAVNVLAQEPGRNVPVSSKYMISAKAGGVNLVEGSVTVARANGTGGVVLKGDQIEIDEKVSTGADGRVEILLNPGSYLRLGANSSAEFKTTSLDDLQIKLDGGSVVFEVFATNEFTVSVFTPKTMVELIDSGIYRFDIGTDGAGTIAVTEGKAIVGTIEIKEGRTGTLGDGKVVTAKFDRDKRDELATWSRTRSKALAAMTASIRNRDVRDSLMSSFVMGRWGIMDSFGLWVLNGRYGTYCFLPFGYGWHSPYGYGLGPGIGWYNLPPVVYYPTVGVPNNSRPRDLNNKTQADQVRPAAPPFTKLQRDRDVVRTTKLDFPNDASSPTRSAPISMPGPIIDAAPSSARAPSKKPGN